MRYFFALINRKINKLIFSNENVAAFILKRIPIQTIRVHLGPHSLSPIEQFALDGYESRLFRGLELFENSLAVVFGGYLGNSSKYLVETFSCRVIIVEPVPAFVQVLEHKFRSNSKVSILEFAISNSNSYVKLNISGERTSSYIPIESDFIQVKSKSSADFVNEIERDIDFLEINIEGAEYEVLEELINTGCITRIVIVNIQFHKINENSELERQVLRNRLNLTHQLEFNYDWVWERWVRR